MNEALKIIIDNLYEKIKFIRSENKTISSDINIDGINNIEDLLEMDLSKVSIDEKALLDKIKTIQVEANKLIEEIKVELVNECKEKGKVEPHIENMLNSITDSNGLMNILKNTRKRLNTLDKKYIIEDNGKHQNNVKQEELKKVKIEEFEKNFGLDAFMRREYGLSSISNLDIGLLKKYLEKYKLYLEKIIKINPELKPKIDSNIKETDSIIEGINKGIIK